MNKNYLGGSFLFVLAIALIFTLLSAVDYDRISVPFSFKPVNFLSDILSDKNSDTDVSLAENLPNTNNHPKDTIANKNNSCPPGVKCIENFSGNQFPLERFFDKLNAAKRGETQVRIAWYGDSFTDADLLVSDLRDTLQSIYGGNGVGFVPITHEAAAFRKTIKHSFGGWKTSSIITNPKSNFLGINGHAYRPDSANYLQFGSSRNYKHTRKFDVFRLFYSSSYDAEARISLNDSIRETVSLARSQTPGMITLNHNHINKVKLSFPDSDDIVVYGASLEDSTGLYIDNFSIKGNSGIGLLAISDKNLSNFDSLLNYDLIVLQFGLNAVTSETKSFDNYIKGMSQLIAKFRRTFPGTPILVMSVSDRSERRQGEYLTMQSIKGMVNAQMQIARDNKTLFWNLFEAMGGENSMAKFVAAKPPLANKDYTHLNFEGGKQLGLILARSIIHEEKKYTERRRDIVAN